MGSGHGLLNFDKEVDDLAPLNMHAHLDKELCVMIPCI